MHVLVGVRARTREALDSCLVHGDDHVGLSVGATARADAGSVERSCRDAGVSVYVGADG